MLKEVVQVVRSRIVMNGNTKRARILLILVNGRVPPTGVISFTNSEQREDYLCSLHWQGNFLWSGAQAHGDVT